MGKVGFLPCLSTKCFNASVYRRHGDVSWTDVQSGLNGRWHKIRLLGVGMALLDAHLISVELVLVCSDEDMNCVRD